MNKSPEDWRRALVPSDSCIRDAMTAIGESRQHICMVIEHDQRLVGTVTDGDIRRAILCALSVDEPVSKIMNTSPVSAPEGTPRDVLLATMEAKGIREIPLIDNAGRVTGLHSLHRRPEEHEARDNWVVLMAGGVGKRLRPHTNKVPKPMLEVGRQPVLETIMGQIMRHGFRKFFISINYKADVIKSYFGDGSAFGAEIKYLHEDRPLGTAGALSLVEGSLDAPLLVVNGDVLNLIDFSSLLQYHHEHGAMATMCVRDSEFQVPFGIVDIQDGTITRIVEKPSQRHFVNAGVYVIDPRALEMITDNTALDMPDLFNALISDEHKTVAFPIGEYWTDIGHLEDLHRADADFEKNFG